MTNQEKIELAELLKVLCDLDRFSDCSDRFFRQVFAQRVQVVKANGYIDKLLADAGEEGNE
jgi:hypothetical protein|nr:MAG TPA: hypothetical protein [Caudoviricetes sp.]